MRVACAHAVAIRVVAPRCHQRLLPPCRVTNTSQEIYRGLGVADPDPEKEEVLTNVIQVYNPELGVLENRVHKEYLQEMINDSGVDVEETAYWFHTPPGGWSERLVRYRPAEEVEATFPEPYHADAEEGSRVGLDDLEEGRVYTGTITDCWLYHGIQVDIGAAYDGLVWITQDTWLQDGVREALMPGEEVAVRVHAVRQEGLYRWPLQLELLEPAEVAAVLPPPEQYQAPINHEWCDEQGWGIQEICEATGRVFEPANYFIPIDEAQVAIGMEMAYGYDAEDSDVYMQHPMVEYMENQGQIQIDDAMRALAM